jgi:hypothetical protein
MFEENDSVLLIWVTELPQTNHFQNLEWAIPAID